MRILLTGAAGFIGSHIGELLRTRGHEVVAVDNYLPAAHGEAPETSPEVHRVDVRETDALGRLLDGVDAVCHQAAMVGAGVSAADAPAYAGLNDLGTASLLAAMAAAGCRRLVLASSMVVYGDGRYRKASGEDVQPAPRRRDDLDAGDFDVRDPTTGEPLCWAPVAEDAPLRPRSLYAASKVAQENFALAWALATSGSVIALRYHNVYGDRMPRDTPYSGVAALFRSALAAGRPPRVFEDGAQLRDFVHVGDVARANLLAIESLRAGELAGCTALNVASGHPITIGEVARLLAAADGQGLRPEVTGQYRGGDVRHIIASPQRAADLLGFVASVPPADGIAGFARAPLRGA